MQANRQAAKRLSPLAECGSADSARLSCHTWAPATGGFVGKICHIGWFTMLGKTELFIWNHLIFNI